ncbi:MAG: mechanosensitive ion channel family protein [Acetobacteraceae bacterium]|nr:mechanosensitive ion channel family protein [Acetobacteraceae bacterium]
MTNLPATTMAAISDPLVITLVVLALGALLTHLLFRRRRLGRAVARVIFLIALTIALLKANVVPYEPLRSTGIPFEDAVRRALAAAWWLWAAWFLVGVVRALIIAEHRPREGKLIQDLLAGLIYLSAVFAVIAYVFGLPIQGLLATSGVIAIILGLALQSTLSDVFSGIVLNFSQPYRPGDWISIEGGTDGRVIEMNWRATHVLTAKRDLAIVPNSAIAKAKVVNTSSPFGVHGMNVTVQLDRKATPASGIKILEQALLNCRLVLTQPAPSITVTSITGSGTQFEIGFFAEDLAHAADAQNELLDLIYRHVVAAGVDLASIDRSLSSVPESDTLPNAADCPERALNLVVIFASLTPDERQSLAARMKQKTIDAGEVLLEPGVVLQSLFIIGMGVLSLTQVVARNEIELMRLGPGDHFGEIGLLTGTPLTARISALIPTTVYELTKDDLAPILEARATVAQELGRELARRQAAGRLITSPEMAQAVPLNRVASWFADRLHKLFDLTREFPT